MSCLVSLYTDTLQGCAGLGAHVASLSGHVMVGRICNNMKLAMKLHHNPSSHDTKVLLPWMDFQSLLSWLARAWPVLCSHLLRL
jgi:hypothetical protein